MRLDQNLGSQRQPLLVKLIELGERPLLDVRKYYIKDGEDLPTKKGISLNVSQLAGLLKVIADNTEAISNHFDEPLTPGIASSAKAVSEKLVGRRLGRAFHSESLNGKREITLSSDLEMAFSRSNLSVGAHVLDAVHQSLDDVLDEDDSFLREAILDRLNMHLLST